eukprot:TRINITY_DN3129_c2_g1_i1.p1 TRINITY_DN3129_c2_g1~~TRINITY_DN3129_c2_g1_i1.p1  ORF type:complete len:1130 (+),score=309.69 TRINITY_DN3129_c2_g1_i1:147-3536(+)
MLKEMEDENEPKMVQLEEHDEKSRSNVGNNSIHFIEDEDPMTRYVYPNNFERNSTKKFVNNSIRTSKYSILSFIPKFLKEQFARLANIYFLVIIVFQQFPGISPTGRWTTLGTLSVVMALTAVKEIWEDLKRHTQDRQTNNRKTNVIRNGTVIEVSWKNISVGDIVKVENRSYIPADLILISSSESSGLCYIETANLDGETNLKSRQSLPETAQFVDLESINKGLKGSILKAEHPNPRLYNFDGSIQMGDQVYSLEAKQTLLRGSMLRNTSWIYGIVVYTGNETKLMKNSAPGKMKRTNVERTANVQIIYMFVLLIIISILSTIGYTTWGKRNAHDAWYLGFGNGRGIEPVWAFLTFVILYNNFIPISLYVSVELVKFGQAYFINNDAKMWDPVSDTPALARTSNLNEELGQVEYIFSDKTGTLTCNKMEFKKCTFGGVKYGTSSETSDLNDENEILKKANMGHLEWHDATLIDAFDRNGEDESSQMAREAMTLLSVCHTVIPEEVDGKIVFQASSPDEAALVKAAKYFKFEFYKRTPRTVTVKINGKDREYQLLNVLEFTNERKRMSVIFRDDTGKIILYSKGADTVIYERLAKENPYATVTRKHLDEFAAEGLRTLCLARLEITPEAYKSWQALYHKASTKIGNREQELHRVAELIEKDMFLLGATAVEDQLQLGVPETIATLGKAGIKIWVLTGDKQETAINIGFSCRLLEHDMDLIIINKDTEEATNSKLDEYISKYRDRSANDFGKSPLGLIIDGTTLNYALDDKLKLKLLELAIKCKAVICCRVTPGQKASVVRLVRKNLRAITLAIGDGANDVSMIQAAHVGVGISGEEGLQAARASDYAIAQFRFLQRLLLVHGRNAYRKISKLILYSFYKNILLYLIQLWFTFYNGFSGQSLFERWTISMYNVLFTLLPAVVFGIQDREVNDRMVDKFPELYRSGIRGRYFNSREFWGWVINAFFHSFLAFFIPVLALQNDVISPDGKNLGLWGFGAIVYSCAIVIVTLKLALESRNWNILFMVVLWGSAFLWILWLLIYGSLWSRSIGIGVDLYKVGSRFLDTWYYWFLILLVGSVAMWRDFTWKYIKRNYMPLPYHIVQEIQYMGKKNKYSMAELELELESPHTSPVI